MNGLPKWVTDWAVVIGALAALIGTLVAVLQMPPIVSLVTQIFRMRTSAYKRRKMTVRWWHAALILAGLAVCSGAVLLPRTQSVGSQTIQGSHSRMSNVVNDSKPHFGDSVSIPDQAWTRNMTIAPLTLPAAVGGDGMLRYSVSPTLPDGLSFDDTSRQITGRAIVAIASTEFEFTVSDDDGDKATLRFYISVDYPPPFPCLHRPEGPYRIHSKPDGQASSKTYDAEIALQVIGKVGDLDGSPLASWWEVIIGGEEGYYYGYIPISSYPDSIRREQAMAIIKDTARSMYTSSRDDYLGEIIPRVEGGVLCNELVDLLSLAYTSDRDDLIVRLAGHLRYPLSSSCVKALLAMVYSSAIPRVADVLDEAILEYSCDSGS